MPGKLILEYRGQRAEEEVTVMEIEALAAAIGVSAEKLDTCCACPYWGQMECQGRCSFPEEARELWADLQLRLWGLIRGAGLQGPIPEDERRVKPAEYMPPMHGPNIDDGHPTRHCGHCHTCGTPLKRALDGEEWCSGCGDYKRYPSHGWAVGAWGAEQDLICPQPGTGPSKQELLGVIGHLLYWGRRVVERRNDALDHLPAALKQAEAVVVRTGQPELEKAGPKLTVKVTVNRGMIEQVDKPACVRVEVRDLDCEAIGESGESVYP
jgi:hypothetical protein